MNLIDISSLKDVLSSFTKILDEITKHWFRELLLVTGMCLILFATQLAIVPLNTVNNGFNIFIALAVVGFGIYWYLFSYVIGFLAGMLLSTYTKINAFIYASNVIGLIIGAVCLIFSSIIIFPFAHYCYSIYWHLCIAVIAHILLFICFKRAYRVMQNFSATPKPNGNGKP